MSFLLKKDRLKHRRNPVPEHCKGCVHLHTGGVRSKQYDSWCCHLSSVAAKAVGRCKLLNAKTLIKEG